MRAVTDVVETTAPFLSRILVHDERRAYLLSLERVDHFRAGRNHCDVHSGGGTYRVRRTLTALAARLDPKTFMRVNKSDIVRLDAIAEIQPWSHGDFRVVLHDGTTLSWSRRWHLRCREAQVARSEHAEAEYGRMQPPQRAYSSSRRCSRKVGDTDEAIAHSLIRNPTRRQQ